jgi:LacI family transcriptional regulator
MNHRPPLRVTIYEIARRAGVSSSTVARVLRGGDKRARRDSEARAETIRSIASDLGYRANLRARAFSERRTNGIALLYQDDAPVIAFANDNTVHGIARELRKHDLHLLLVPIDDAGSWDELVSGGSVDGCIACAPLPREVRLRL